jgi:acyl-CoA reductase-like NAD-dependent aldehyde dehydrogenase
MNLALTDPSLLRDALFLGGTWLKPDECDLLEVRNPATGAAVTSVPSGRREDVVAAINAAEQALPGRHGNYFLRGSAFRRLEGVGERARRVASWESRARSLHAHRRKTVRIIRCAL